MTDEENITNLKAIEKPLPDQKITFEIHLRYPKGSPPLPTLEELGMGLPYQRKYYTHEEFSKLYSADPEDIEKVRAFSGKYGLNLKSVNTILRLVTVSGTVESTDRAFNTDLKLYKGLGHIFIGHGGTVSIPQELEGVADFVLGLDRQPIAVNPKGYSGRENSISHTSGEIDGSYGIFRRYCKENTTPSGGKAWYPDRLARLYNFPGPDIATGKGQSVALLEFMGGFEIKTLEKYFKDYIEVEMPVIKAISVDNGRNNPGHSGNLESIRDLIDYEVYLDIEVVGSIAYGAQINVYFGPTWILDYVDYAAFWKTLASAVHDEANNNTVISTSWGWTEDCVCNEGKLLIDQVLQEAASMNITICAYSGDDGTRCLQSDGRTHVMFPASSPYVLSCGGTELTVENGKIQKEHAWNQNTIDFVTGGGYSRFFAQPSYQKGICKESSDKRGVPDVAANATLSYLIFTHHNKEPVPEGGGTSATAPLWAALIALLNEALGAPIGLINPFLYRIGGTQGVFNDITKGDNAVLKFSDTDKGLLFPAVPGYNAAHGWDECTGWGSPNGENLLKSLKDED